MHKIHMLLSKVVECCFSLGFNAVKGHHEQGNSYKEQHLIGPGLPVQKFSP